MALDVLTEDKITIREKVNDWEEAIHIAAEPLVAQNYIEPGYVEAMIDSVKTLGPYIVIAPNVAIAHARPDDHVNKVGISLLKLGVPINFSEKGHEAALVFVFCSTDHTSHLTILQQLAQVLGDTQRIEALMRAQDKASMITIFKGDD
ncbi:PTS sugar transporter subunit IIA [Staphylococcus agnetis]|uniref:PTS sugar transporter subunit IIA n=1 Tax=Staphylococcus agnetis TaxID=985762 RepID=UPI0004E2B241|nr:PTS sugar transporter subunit IIA [Staphylococcus agnetis]KFE42079.1 PTS system transporter subunit IIA [Staphylococcus agnetis]NJH65695.1 PTS sugar transporter subunit IIA [Staphylococcus agnetis]NJH96665.1 PTS sugar transporter subunit IIA [Staphylococcus agnetis]PTH47764.1 PTS ascorbate transporter subunit IIA [Staphylococcus agnetis]PTH74537.1 PTS ascorbate transporter subunit IIA [Staphylococcus agnetis]